MGGTTSLKAVEKDFDTTLWTVHPGKRARFCAVSLPNPKDTSSSPCHLQSPVSSQQQPNMDGTEESDDQDDMDDEELLMMEDGSPLMIDESSESGDRIIYPWMKKIHVAGADGLYLVVKFK
ncbi:hypothetical protein LSTR_LSTR015075 [Laodelphax striatellus]|uniref:Uncharacterized protein n=1 Tax=Laodelphax striatellus TaxID=195883 RepID=A0A482WM44_LAOST|nr:hypothetical protein LSTR_LSTR015075 [Laodelphax striatellus]